MGSAGARKLAAMLIEKANELDRMGNGGEVTLTSNKAVSCAVPTEKKLGRHSDRLEPCAAL